MSMILNHPKLEMLPLSELHLNPDRLRKRKKKQIEQLISSLRRFGFRGALLIDENGMIVAGNGMFEAATIAGYTEVPAIRMSFLNDAERRAFIVAHNRLAELSEWDDAKLKLELEFLFEHDLHLDGTGFELSALDFSIGNEPPSDEELVELPLADATAVSRVGDLWMVGDDLRLYCGDSRDSASYEALLADERAQLVFGDPPYNVKLDGHVGGNGKFKPREWAMATGEMSPPEFTAFLRGVFRNCVRFSTNGSLHLQCMDWRHLREILDAGDGVYSEFKQLVVWAKPTGGQGAFLRSRHELILIFKSGRDSHVNNVLGSKRYRTNVVEYAGANGFYKGRARDLKDHSTIKPTALVADFLLDFSNPGDLVLDPFSGSGTTLQACQKTRRRGAAIEIDPVFVDTALRRLRDATGLVPIHADGRTFDEVAADRQDDRDCG